MNLLILLAIAPLIWEKRPEPVTATTPTISYWWWADDPIFPNTWEFMVDVVEDPAFGDENLRWEAVKFEDGEPVEDFCDHRFISDQAAKVFIESQVLLEMSVAMESNSLKGTAEWTANRHTVIHKYSRASSTPRGAMEKGDSAPIAGKENRYLYINFNGIVGWVYDPFGSTINTLPYPQIPELLRRIGYVHN